MDLLRELEQEIRNHPAPLGMDKIRTDLDEALTIIDRLLDYLDQTTPDEPWMDTDGNRVPAVRDWLMLVCFSKDHELYDAILALRGRRGRKWRMAGSDA